MSRRAATTCRLDASRATRGHRGECSHLLEGCCDYGICEREFEEAFESDPNVGTDSPSAEWHAACWARNWVVDHYKDMQEDTCDSFSSC